MEGWGFCVAPAYANQKQTYYSLLGMGIVDAKVMRNVNVNVLETLFGGENDEDAEVKV